MVFGCLCCRISPNGKLLVILGGHFIFFFDVAGSSFMLLDMLFPLTDLDFCLVYIHVGVTWMDHVYPHRSLNGYMTGTVVSVEVILILMVLRYSIGGVVEFGGVVCSNSL